MNLTTYSVRPGNEPGSMFHILSHYDSLRGVIVFQNQYPSIAKWMEYSWIEVGDCSDWGKGSFVRALNIGGIVFEGEDEYESLEAALEDLERGLAAWLEVNEEKPSS